MKPKKFNIRENFFDPPELKVTNRYKVYLNGKEVKDCFRADEELGLVQCYALDMFGFTVLNPFRGEPDVAPPRYGRVHIVRTRAKNERVSGSSTSTRSDLGGKNK